jgi:hypothetical protein
VLTMNKFTHIRVNQQTKGELDRLKALGQSYDGLLRELLAIAEALMPMPPAQGPPLPRGLGIRWTTRRAREIERTKGIGE